MNWKNNFVRINRMEDDFILFGDHYDKGFVKAMIENYPEEFDEDFILFDTSFIWIRFGIVWIDDERQNGYYVLTKKPKSKRGVIKATYLTSKKSIEFSKKQEEMLKQYGF